MKRSARPRVIVNFARTADGKVSTRNYTPTGFASKSDLRRLLEIRAHGDALIVGQNTLAVDGMSMTLPDPALRAGRVARGMPPEPLRVIVSNSGKLDPGLDVFRKAGADRIIFSSEKMPAHLQKALAPLATLHLSRSDKIGIGEMLSCLRRDYGVRTLVCEGGPVLFRSLLEAACVDEIYVTIAPIIFGGAQAPTMTGTDSGFLGEIADCLLVDMETVGAECYLHYRVRHSP